MEQLILHGRVNIHTKRVCKTDISDILISLYDKYVYVVVLCQILYLAVGLLSILLTGLLLTGNKNIIPRVRSH